MSTTFSFPKFRPHPLVVGGHLQTIFGAWIPGTSHSREVSIRRFVELEDGDRLVLMDDFPIDGWVSGGDVAVLVHGLGGSAESPHIRRIAAKLRDQGMRTFRLNLRGCGAGRGLSKKIYHAGRSEDVQAAMEVIRHLCPGSRVLLSGFSLGGNIVLKWLGEHPAMANALVDRAIAVNPPVNLEACTFALQKQAFGVYDRYFTNMLYRQLCDSFEVTAAEASAPPIRRIGCFNEAITAPRSGFKNASHYYDVCSAAQFTSNISVPTMILSAADDPVVPVRILEDLDLSKSVNLHIAESGGHLGYYGRSGMDPDRWWIDWRVVDWLSWQTPQPALLRAA